MTADRLDEIFADDHVMAIFRRRGLDETMRLAEAAFRFGVRVMEVPLMAAEDEAVLRVLSERGREQGFVVGAGTVIDVAQVDAAVAAGAQFTVAPGWDPEIADASVANGLPHIPGVGSGTEVQAALKAGMRWLKAFPAESLGPRWIVHQLGPFPEVRFVATGGISAENAGSFLAAGCRAVALGSAFDSPAQMERLTRTLGGDPR